MGREFHSKRCFRLLARFECEAKALASKTDAYRERLTDRRL